MFNNSRLYEIEKFDLKDKFDVITHYKVVDVKPLGIYHDNFAEWFEVECIDLNTNEHRILYGLESDLLQNMITSN